MRGIDALVAGVGAQGLDRGPRERQRLLIEARLRDHQPTDRGRGLALLQRLAPRHLARAAGELRRDRLGHLAEQPVELFRQSAAGVALGLRELDEGREPAQARIRGQRGQQRLGRGQAIAEVGELVQIEIEQAMAGEERLARRMVDGGEVLLVGAQRRRQVGGGLLDALRRGAFDDRHDRLLEPGERPHERDVVAAERHVRRDHVLSAGVDLQREPGIAERDRGEDEGRCDHLRGAQHEAVDRA